MWHNPFSPKLKKVHPVHSVLYVTTVYFTTTIESQILAKPLLEEVDNDPREKARMHGVTIKVEVATHGRLRTRNTSISPHVVSDPRQRRRSMSSVANFAPSRPVPQVRTLRRHASFSRWAEEVLARGTKKKQVNLALGGSHSDNVPDVFLGKTLPRCVLTVVKNCCVSRPSVPQLGQGSLFKH